MQFRIKYSFIIITTSLTRNFIKEITLFKFWQRWASPKYFAQYATKCMPWLTCLTVILFCTGLSWGLFFAPEDYQQGDAFRIIYVHVPAAALSMGVYVSMAIMCAIGLIWKIKLNFLLAQSSAIIGATFTAIALITGSLWGKPMWGTWWQWDARLTSELLLFFLYLGYIALYRMIPSKDVAESSSSILAIIGVVNIPIIHYSVYWWQSLHQGSTIFKFSKPSISPEMLWPLLVMLGAFACIYILFLLFNTRMLIHEQKVQLHFAKLRQRG